MANRNKEIRDLINVDNSVFDIGFNLVERVSKSEAKDMIDNLNYYLDHSGWNEDLTYDIFLNDGKKIYTGDGLDDKIFFSKVVAIVESNHVNYRVWVSSRANDNVVKDINEWFSDVESIYCREYQ